MSQITPETAYDLPRPDYANAAIVLADGSVIWGRGAGAFGTAVGEVVFNTSMTGYQEVLSDPSYAGRIITFTFPHIGNVGANPQDLETTTPAARGCILRSRITDPANWRASCHLDAWLKSHNIIAISGVDTRALTRRIRLSGAPVGAIVHVEKGTIDLKSALDLARSWPGLNGMDLASDVTRHQTSDWRQGRWSLAAGYQDQTATSRHVVAIDYGAKHNILRCLASAGCKVTVVGAHTSAEEILALAPDGVFLSNGPGDPAATGRYAVPVIRALLDKGLPIFGICLGHQLLALALGAQTRKMECGHRGGNHPVKDLTTGKVEITSQNHGFVVDEASLPKGVVVSHRSLFDGSVEGIRVEGKPVFSVQYHPEASPGPQDSHYLFDRFVQMIPTKS